MATLISAYEATKILGVSKTTVCRIFREGQVPSAHKIGVAWVVNDDDIKSLKEERDRWS